MTVTWLTGDAAVDVQIAGVQATAAVNVDASDGSITLAFAHACKGVVLWLQALIAKALALTRLGTSFGTDVDSWIGQFGMTRIPAVAASGSVTMSRKSAGTAAIILAGTYVSTGPGGTQFVVTTDTTNPAYSATLFGYVLASTATSLSVPVACTTAGTVGNVAAGTLTSFVTPIPYVDSVANSVAFTNGIAAESDIAVKARVPLYFAGLRSAIPNAILSAASAVQQGVKLQLRSNYPQIGFYTLYADDGSGAAPDSFIAAITTAVQAVSAEGVTPSVIRPTNVATIIDATLGIAAGATPATVESNVSSALAAFVAAIPIGGTLPYLQIASVIFGADSNVTAIPALTVNGSQVDVVAPEGGLLVFTTPSVS